MISESNKLKTWHKNQMFPFVLISIFKYLLKRCWKPTIISLGMLDVNITLG